MLSRATGPTDAGYYVETEEGQSTTRSRAKQRVKAAIAPPLLYVSCIVSTFMFVLNAK